MLNQKHGYQNVTFKSSVHNTDFTGNPSLSTPINYQVPLHSNRIFDATWCQNVCEHWTGGQYLRFKRSSLRVGFQGCHRCISCQQNLHFKAFWPSSKVLTTTTPVSRWALSLNLVTSLVSRPLTSLISRKGQQPTPTFLSRWQLHFYIILSRTGKTAPQRSPSVLRWNASHKKRKKNRLVFCFSSPPLSPEWKKRLSPRSWFYSCVNIPARGYNDGRAHITVVTFLHKRVFRPKTLEIIIDLPFGFFQ